MKIHDFVESNSYHNLNNFCTVSRQFWCFFRRPKPTSMPLKTYLALFHLIISFKEEKDIVRQESFRKRADSSKGGSKKDLKKDTMMQKEERNKGAVSSKFYLRYFRDGGGRYRMQAC